MADLFEWRVSCTVDESVSQLIGCANQDYSNRLYQVVNDLLSSAQLIRH